jgi:CoA:oxalate CoA-transferase
MSQKPLAGIRVIDLTRILAGPYCTMILKNLGAEVIKVERPGIGDEARFIGPFINGEAKKSAYFMSVNAGKKSLCLQLKEEEGRNILAELIEKSDVLIENYRPGTLKRLGFSEERIRELNPLIVYSSVSGFGQAGPDSQKRAFDMMIQGLSGIISITGLEDGQTARVGTSISDIIAGMYAAIGIISALYRRSVINTGGRVDIAMLDSTVAILENAIARYQVTKEPPGPIGTRHPSITPFGSFRTRDSELIIAAGTDLIFKMLCDLLERPELKSDERFKTNELRTEHARELTEILNSVLSTNTTEYWIAKLGEIDIPCARVHTIADLFQYDQIIERNMLVPVDGEEDFRIAGNPVKFGDVPDDKNSGKYPALGEHNDLIMGEFLGYSPEEIDRLYEKGILSK